MKKETRRKALVVAGAFALIAAVGATAGTTFAKYTDNVSKDAMTATVAKWGFTVSAQGELLGKMYDKNAKITTSGDNAVIVSNGDYNVVAPGSSGSITIQVKGTAEVNARISVKVDGDFQDISLTKADSDASDELDDGWTYNPIKWTVSKNGSDKNVKELTEEDGNAGTVLEGWESDTRTYKANSSSVDLSYTLSWAWIFEKDEDTNAKDTMLGKMYSDSGTKTEGLYTAVTKLKIPSIKITVEQINETL